MNKHSILQYLSVLMFFFVSCTYEIVDIYDSNEDSSEDLNSELTTIKVSISDEPSTKTYMSDDTGENGSRVKIFWSKSDYITVKSGDDSYIFQFKEYDESMSYADFMTIYDLPELESNTTLTAEYPHTGKPDLSKQYGTLQYLYLYHYMTAEYHVDTDNCSWEDVSFTFKTQTPILKLTLRNDAFKGQIVKNVQFSIGNNIITSSLGTFTGSDDNGEFTAYFAIDPQKINANASITAVCNDTVYEANISAVTSLVAGNLYRINKTMNISEVFMRYSEDKAIITVYDGASPSVVSSYTQKALNDGYVNLSLEGTVSDSVKDAVNSVLLDTQVNTILNIAGKDTYYVCDEEGFLRWGQAAENDIWISCSLINDINLTRDWEFCVGTSSSGYAGTFDGNNHEISGLIINQESQSKPLALISYSSGLVKNLVLRGGKCKNTETNSLYSALLVGINNGVVENITLGKYIHDDYVSFNLKSPSSSYVGGIVGCNQGLVKDCVNKIPINISIPEDLSIYAGSIVGLSVKNIIQSINYGDITVEGGSNLYIGGVVGRCIDTRFNSGNVFLCGSIGKIYINRNYGKGGVIGESFGTTCVFAGCYTMYGDVVGVKTFGYGNVDHSYTSDYELHSQLYGFYGIYEEVICFKCDEMNTAVEKYNCEYIDKKWERYDDYSYPRLVKK